MMWLVAGSSVENRKVEASGNEREERESEEGMEGDEGGEEENGADERRGMKEGG